MSSNVRRREYLVKRLRSVCSNLGCAQACVPTVLVDSLEPLHRLLLSHWRASRRRHIVWFLELYTCDMQALLSEFSSRVRRLRTTAVGLEYLQISRIVGWFILALCRWVLLRRHFCSSQNVVLVSSELRKAYLTGRDKIDASRIGVLPNRPLEANNTCAQAVEDQLNGFKLPRKFIVLLGQVNSCADFTTLIGIANNLSQRLITTQLECLHCRRIARDSRIVDVLGQVDPASAVRLMIGATAVAALYRTDSPNQALAASSKLQEAMALGKPIIVSRNAGALRDLRDANYVGYVVLDEGADCARKILQRADEPQEYGLSQVNFNEYLDAMLTSASHPLGRLHFGTVSPNSCAKQKE